MNQSISQSDYPTWDYNLKPPTIEDRLTNLEREIKEIKEILEWIKWRL